MSFAPTSVVCPCIPQGSSTGRTGSCLFVVCFVLSERVAHQRSPSLPQDYPSVGQVAQALTAANIQPIFAVTGTTLPVYQVRVPGKDLPAHSAPSHPPQAFPHNSLQTPEPILLELHPLSRPAPFLAGAESADPQVCCWRAERGLQQCGAAHHGCL